MKNCKNTLYIDDYYGNNVLYKMCYDNPEHTVANIVSSKIWLIGRSYSVSPQRKFKNPRHNKFFRFFDKLALEIVNDNKFSMFIDDFIQKSNLFEYSFDFKSDENFIVKLFNFTRKFNEGLIEKIQDVGDKSFNINQISFITKYLHFHLPRIFFIKDLYTKNNAIKEIKKIDLGKKVLDYKKIIYQKIGFNTKHEKYSQYNDFISHFLRCYILAAEKKLTPRELDTYLLN